ncbi:hypothetical protein [Salana multivorans]
MRVLHLNDCAFVARTITAQARSEGRPWRHLTPEKVRPATTPTGPLAPLVYAPYMARRALAVGRSDVVHVHYGTSARLVRQRGIPRRPYVLSLHGTDIRTQWLDPRFRPELQRGIEAASIVLYTNLDTAEATLSARPDALHLPQAVDPRIVPAWGRRGASGERARVVFAPRWSPDKGVTQQLELAAALHRAYPDAELVGLDWGPGAAEAAAAGVRLVPTMPHEEYLDLLATADVVIGQADTILSVSDFEAMLIGAPLAALGHRLPSGDGTAPPTLDGSLDDVVEQVGEALADPEGMARRLGGREWVEEHHHPARIVAMLDPLYRRAAKEWAG